MSTRESLVAAALEVLERDGESQFSTRAVCSLAEVTAPTLYHHFGNADALLSAAIARAFERFLASKKKAAGSPDPVAALAEGWDDYVRFAAERPRLYAAMMARVLSGAEIPAAEQAYGLLIDRIKAVAAEGKLAMEVEAAAQVVWASANGAALLCATASRPGKPAEPLPDPVVMRGLRDAAIRTIRKADAQEDIP